MENEAKGTCCPAGAVGPVGEPGKNYEYIYLAYCELDLLPSLYPDNDWLVGWSSYATNQTYNYRSVFWQKEPQGLTQEKPYLFRAERQVPDDAEENDKAISDWSEPRIVAKYKVVDDRPKGENGPPGLRGCFPPEELKRMDSIGLIDMLIETTQHKKPEDKLDAYERAALWEDFRDITDIAEELRRREEDKPNDKSEFPEFETEASKYKTAYNLGLSYGMAGSEVLLQECIRVLEQAGDAYVKDMWGRDKRRQKIKELQKGIREFLK